MSSNINLINETSILSPHISYFHNTLSGEFNSELNLNINHTSFKNDSFVEMQEYNIDNSPSINGIFQKLEEKKEKNGQEYRIKSNLIF